MQRTIEIPRHSWEAYLNNLSHERKDRPVRIQVESKDVGDQVLAESYPLLGLTLETKGPDTGAIEIMVDRAGRGHLSHLIAEPERIYEATMELPGGALCTCLDIESRAGDKTLVLFE